MRLRPAPAQHLPAYLLVCVALMLARLPLPQVLLSAVCGLVAFSPLVVLWLTRHRRTPQDRRYWRLVAGALWMFTCANLVWFYYLDSAVSATAAGALVLVFVLLPALAASAVPPPAAGPVVPAVRRRAGGRPRRRPAPRRVDARSRLGARCDGAVLRQQPRSAVRPEDTVCRQGGDEFLVLCQGLTPQAVASVRARLREACSVAGAGVTGSVGIALGGASTEPRTLLRAADADMYEQKRAARTTLPEQRVPEPAPL